MEEKKIQCSVKISDWVCFHSSILKPQKENFDGKCHLWGKFKLKALGFQILPTLSLKGPFNHVCKHGYNAVVFVVVAAYQPPVPSEQCFIVSLDEYLFS